MNGKNIIYGLVWVLCFSSCYDEKDIIPLSGDKDMLRYEFPQGNNSWDKDIEAISEEFGVYLIYKDFKHADFNRSWTGAASVEYFGETLTDEQVGLSTKFMKEQVFAHLTKDITKKVLPLYFYMAYDFHNTIGFIPGVDFKVAHTLSDDGLDFWVSCLFYGDPDPLTGEKVETPEEPEDFRIRRTHYLIDIFSKSFKKGNFAVAPGFSDDIDYKTAVIAASGYEKDENFYIMRGFPGRVSERTGKIDPLSPNPLVLNEHFLSFVYLGMRYTKAEYEKLWPSSVYKLVHEKRQLVIDYMRDVHHIDLESIAVLTESW